MAKKKRYYWLKLKDDFFNDRIIRKMRKLDNGSTCLFIYQRMLLMSLNCDGKLVFEGLEESMFEQLADELEEDVDMIRETIDFCTKYELLTIDGDVYYMTMFEDLVGSECDSTDRVRKHRKLKAALQCNTAVTVSNDLETVELPPVTKCNTEKERKKDLEEDRELNIYLEKRLKEKREEYKRNNKTETEELKQISQSISQSVPQLSQEESNSFSLSAEEIQYFIDCWSNLNASSPIRKLNEKQTVKLIENVKRYGEGQEPMETINCLIDSITDSNFLMGDTEPKFEILIDWVLKPENWKKVIDGEYQNWENPEI